MDTSFDPRFPVGTFKRPLNITSAHIQGYIQTIASFAQGLRAELEGFSETDLDTPYREGGWTVRQVVHHCADSHMNAFIRFKSAMTETGTTIKPYNQDVWAQFADSKLPVTVSLQLLEALHTRWVALLQSMSPADFSRTYVHPEYGKTITLEEALASYDWHCRTHLGHVKIVSERIKAIR